MQKAKRIRDASNDYRQAILIANPHTKDPQILLKMLERELDDYYLEPELDKSGMKALKIKLMNNPGGQFEVKEKK